MGSVHKRSKTEISSHGTCRATRKQRQGVRPHRRQSAWDRDRSCFPASTTTDLQDTPLPAGSVRRTRVALRTGQPKLIASTRLTFRFDRLESAYGLGHSPDRGTSPFSVTIVAGGSWSEGQPFSRSSGKRFWNFAQNSRRNLGLLIVVNRRNKLIASNDGFGMPAALSHYSCEYDSKARFWSQTDLTGRAFQNLLSLI